MTYAFENLLVDVAGSVATVTFNRPEKLNAITPEMHSEMLACCEQLKADDGVRAVVFTGAGRGFCSGAQVGGGPRPDADAQPWQQLMDEDSWVGRQARAAYLIDKPTIAAVNGVAAGAGMSFALACDIRVGSEHTRFKTVFIERNLAPDAGMTYFLPRIVGSGNALDLILTSRSLEAEEALRMGLLQRLVPHDRLLEEAQSVAATIAAHPPIAAMMSKRSVQRSLDNDFEDQLRYEIRAISIARQAKEDALESARSFVEKRKPTYHGR